MSVNARVATAYVGLAAVAILSVVGFAFGLAGFFKANDPKVAHKADIKAALGSGAVQAAIREVNSEAAQGGLAVKRIRIVRVTSKKDGAEADVYMAVDTVDPLGQTGHFNLVAHEDKSVWHVSGLVQGQAPKR